VDNKKEIQQGMCDNSQEAMRLEYLATFYTHSGSLKYLRVLEKLGIKNAQLLPVPRKISASCGVALKFKAPGLVEEMQIPEVERIYQIKEGAFHLVYSGEKN